MASILRKNVHKASRGALGLGMLGCILAVVGGAELLRNGVAPQLRSLAASFAPGTVGSEPRSSSHADPAATAIGDPS